MAKEVLSNKLSRVIKSILFFISLAISSKLLVLSLLVKQLELTLTIVINILDGSGRYSFLYV